MGGIRYMRNTKRLAEKPVRSEALRKREMDP